MKHLYKRLLYILTAALTLAGCTANTTENLSGNDTESSESLTEYPVETENLPETTITESVTEKITETAAEDSPENNITVNEEDPLPDPENYDPRTVEYINSLWALEKFRQTPPADILIADLNGDNTPEVVVQIATVVSISDVFSIKDGKAFYVPPAPGSYTPDYYEKAPDYSFDGGSLQCYKKDNESVFLADCWIGGSAGGTAGIMSMDFDGQQITANAVSRIYKTKAEDTYFWGDEEVSDDEYDRCLDEYMSDLDYTDNYTVYIPKAMHDSELKSCIEFIAEGLDGFYKSLDLNGSVKFPEYTVEMKPVYTVIRKGLFDDDSTAVSYDGFGNITAITRTSNGMTAYENVYDENGRLSEVTEKHPAISDRVYEIDPEDFFCFDGYGTVIFEDNTPSDTLLVEYDDHGRMAKKSLVVSEEIVSMSELSYFALSDESYDPDSRIQWTKEYTYDNRNRLICIEYIKYLQDGSCKPVHYIKTYSYDDSGRFCGSELQDAGESSGRYEIFYSQSGSPEKVTFTDTGYDTEYTLNISEHYHDLKGGVTCLWAKGDTPYKKDIDCFIYFAPVRTISS